MEIARLRPPEAIMNEYLTDIHRYDRRAPSDAVEKIVKHLGIALKRRDAALVSCSTPAELQRVVDEWCLGRLGVSDPQEARAAVDAVCEQMAGDRAKQRVTFYYLVAARLGKLSRL
jgi:hypothetical protein